MTTVVEPSVVPFAGIRSLELEITGRCQLGCSHCLADSGPQTPQGEMTREDWRAVITDAARLGIEVIQLIGGEPTMHPNWQEFAESALLLGRRVEVYSNLYTVHESWWDLFTRDGVSVGTSYYSNDPTEHDKITGKAGSYLRTRRNIREAVNRGVRIRAGIVDVLPGQHVAEARAELERLGVGKISTDRVRAVGRGRLPWQTPTLDEMCGRCTRGRAAILPSGELAGCVLSRDFAVGNVRTTPLRVLLNGQRWAELGNRIPSLRADACPPDDSGDCDPANTEACEPAYD